MVMAIDISITPLTPVPALHGVPTNPNDKMVDLIGTAQDALRYVRARRTPSPRARV